MSKNASVHDRFDTAHQDEFTTVREYWATDKDLVEVVDLRDRVPAFKGTMSDSQS